MLRALQQRARALQRETYALYLAYRDPRVPLPAKIWLALVVGYALSPIDLIPDFIPVVGYLDDLLIVPLGVAVAVRMIPREVLRDCRARAEVAFPDGRPTSRTAAVVIACIWATVLALIALWLWRLHGAG